MADAFIRDLSSRDMSYAYNRLEPHRRQSHGPSTRRSALGYWIPLALTVTIATVGVAAWVWSERRDDESDDNDEKRGASPAPGPVPEFGPQRTSGVTQPAPESGTHGEEEGVFARMSRGLRRTPSPQNIFDGVVAGVAAAGAAVSGVLSTIREEDKRDFEDHSRWSEEARSRGGVASSEGKPGPGGQAMDQPSSSRSLTHPGAKSKGKRKTVAIVISAHTDYHNPEDVSHQEENAVRLGDVVRLSIRIQLNRINSPSYPTSPSIWMLSPAFLSSFMLRI